MDWQDVTSVPALHTACQQTSSIPHVHTHVVASDTMRVFYRRPDHRSCYGTSRRMKAVYVCDKADVLGWAIKINTLYSCNAASHSVKRHHSFRYLDPGYL